ncbi:MAG: alpha/beta hydrolase family protein [Allosphingosinicella sp.]|uniref:alpha/beta hydrolase family protein n=1 Tax=Allosphingosinicella sp. TaxID=2823234 RepID=UPI0039214C2E
MLRMCIAALAVAALPAALAAQGGGRFSKAEPAGGAATADPATRQAILFGVRESVQQMDISPDGTKVAFIGPGPGRSTIGYVVDLADTARQPKVIINSDGNPGRLRWCSFASDSRLVCSVGGIVRESGGILLPYSRLYSASASGGDLKELTSWRTARRSWGFAQSGGALIDWLPDDENGVLIDGATAVERIDLATRRSTPIGGTSGAFAYMTDGRGTIRMRMRGTVRGETGQIDTRTNFFYLPPSGDWRPFGSFDGATGDGILPLDIDADLNAVYALQKLDGRFALYRVKLDGSMASELVYANPRVDVDGTVRTRRGGAVIGVTYAEEKRHVVYFDEDYARLARDLGRAIPQLPVIDFLSSSRDGRKLLIHAGADNDPGRYFVYDRQSRQLDEIMLVRPDLEPVPLANVRTISYPAADGTQIPGYLTLPPGSDGRNLPAVLLPHGGPSARDEWGFDWLAQYLAGQGYAVLQPNYRGSAGFGDAWLQQNGFRSWRTSIGDVIDGGRWLAAEGIADPDRLAIVGWSYGGYAALQAAAVEPGLFKAVAAIAPVTDLQQLKDDRRDYTSHRNTAEFIGNGPHIREGSPLQNVQRISAPVLLFHGDRDLNVAVVHSEKMDRALRAAGRQSELQVYQGLEHDLGDSTSRAHMLNKIGQLLRRTIGR